MASAGTPMNIEEENAFIASLEQTIEDMEYKRASNDIENYMSVSQSLEGLLGNEKTVNHLKDFVVDERCEENVLFLLDVKEYKKMYSDNNYQTNQVSLYSYCNQLEINESREDREAILDSCKNSFLLSFQGFSYSQLYIPLPIIKKFQEDYKPWADRQGDDSLPPITLFDEVANVVLESIRKVL